PDADRSDGLCRQISAAEHGFLSELCKLPSKGPGNEQSHRVSATRSPITEAEVDKLHSQAFRDFEGPISDCESMAKIAAQLMCNVPTMDGELRQGARGFGPVS